MRRKNLKLVYVGIVIFFIAVGLLIGAYFLRAHYIAKKLQDQRNQEVAEILQKLPEAEKSTPPSSVSNTTPPPQTVLPDKVALTVPFTSQAPFAVWDALHEDTCEETSLLMVYHYLNKTDFASPTAADNEIKSMISYENDNDYGPSITIEQLNNIAKNYLGLNNGKETTSATIDDIKSELAAGHPVIVGAAGKILPNPYFRNGGPVYHMLVITGYDQNGFITNDPGIRQGHDFRYTYNGLYLAIHNWDPNNIMNGGKDFLVFN